MTQNETVCPYCKEPAEHVRNSEWRCTTPFDECDVLYFFTAGSMSSKGSRTERELVNMLDDEGYAVMRAPASGAATTRELPDVLAGNAREFYAIEAKSSNGNPIYLTLKEVADLVYFSLNFGAKPRVGVRFDERDWFFFHPAELYLTDSYSRRVKEEDLENGTHFSELVG